MSATKTATTPNGRIESLREENVLAALCGNFGKPMPAYEVPPSMAQRPVYADGHPNALPVDIYVIG